MPFIRPPICLNCGATLPIAKVWWKADTVRGFVLRRTTGVACSTCGSKFIIIQAGVVLAGAIIFVGGVLLAAIALIALGKVLGRFPSVLIGVPLIFLVGLAHFRISPLFARVRPAVDNEAVDYPLSSHRNASI